MRIWSFENGLSAFCHTIYDKGSSLSWLTASEMDWGILEALPFVKMTLHSEVAFDINLTFEIHSEIINFMYFSIGNFFQTQHCFHLVVVWHLEYWQLSFCHWQTPGTASNIQIICFHHGKDFHLYFLIWNKKLLLEFAPICTLHTAFYSLVIVPPIFEKYSGHECSLFYPEMKRPKSTMINWTICQC